MNLDEKAIINPEKLNHMFGGILSLDDIELDSILLFAGPSITFQFNTHHLPRTIPRKWEQRKFNGFNFSLLFSNIEHINISLWKPKMKCSPIIIKKSDYIEIKIIVGDERVISCKSSFLELSDIYGYYESGVP